MNIRSFLSELHEFSQKTFGPRQRVAGVIDHIHKELVEIERKPSDITEWADLLLLSFNGALGAGHSPDDILQALESKLQVNQKRCWPDWRNYSSNEAIEHLKCWPSDAPKRILRGTVIRYDIGITALMRVDSMTNEGNGHYRYYGKHCLGGIHNCSTQDAYPANDADLKLWREQMAGES